jgi:hypothetical protein
MKRKLLLAGAGLLVLLVIVIPLAFTGKLTKPDAVKAGLATSSITGDNSAGGNGQSSSASPASGSSANGSAAGGQSQPNTDKPVTKAPSQPAATDGQETQSGTAQDSKTGAQSGSPSPASGQAQTAGQSAGSSSVSNGTGSGTTGQNQTPPVSAPQPAAAVKVEISIVGKSGESIFGPATVSIQKDNKWGETVMGALHASGVPYRMHDRYTNFVVSVAGQVNEGMHGWSYKVNGQLGSVAAPDKKVTTGDKIIWWYSN